MRGKVRFILVVVLPLTLITLPQPTLQAVRIASSVDQELIFSPLADPSISQMRITNVRNGSVSVSWITDSPATGYVNFGPTTVLGSTAYDDRGDTTVDDTHHVTLSGLSPQTTYYFDVISGATVDDNGGLHYSVTTGPTLGLPPSDTIYGQVCLADGVTPAEGAIVYMTLMDGDAQGSSGQAAPMSTLVDVNGYWTANLGNSRTTGLTSYFSYSSSGDSVAIEAQGATQGTASETVDTSADTPAASMTLIPTPTCCDYDFDNGGTIDVADIMKVASCWQSTDPECASYDLDGDGDIDVVDIMKVAACWGEICP
jgi:hypothetical protein